MMTQTFSQLQQVVADGTRRRLHTAIQCYVSVDGVPVLNDVVSDGSADFRPDDLILWRSAAKPVTAVATLLMLEQSEYSLASTIDDLLPTCPDNAKGISLSQVLSHSTGWPAIDVASAEPRSAILDRLSITMRQADLFAYQPRATWELLAEILEHVTGQNWWQFVVQRLLKPLGLENTFCGLTAEEFARNSGRIVAIQQREKGQLQSTRFSSQQRLASRSPGADFRGPISELGRFYECLRRNDGAIVSAQSLESLIAPVRVGKFDHTLQDDVDFGHGVIVNRESSKGFAYGFGSHASPSAFGHGGAQCSMGFCDPEHRLVVAWAADGLCGEGWHQRRNLAINEAIYQDLGLA